jgi:hypothetical protein
MRGPNRHDELIMAWSEVGLRGKGIWSRLAHFSREGLVTRLRVTAVEEMMAGRQEASLETVLEVFEVFASGALTDEVYILEDVAGKRIAIAPTTLRDKYRRG